MTYNRNRHVELLKRLQDFKNQEKSLSQKSRNEYLELSKYEGAIQSYIYWESRRQFAFLMKKFVTGIIDGQEFSDSFHVLRQKLIDKCDEFIVELDSEKLKDFNPDVRSTGFGSFISFLRAECDNFSEDYQNEEFYNSIKDCFLKLRKVLDEELDITEER